MVKRKCVGSAVYFDRKPAAKKLRKDSGTKQAKPSVPPSPEALLAYQKLVAPIACLYEDVLIEIFKWLPPRDRLRIELVCRKWNQAAKKSWSNFHSCDVHFKHMTAVLVRGGRFVHKLRIRFPRLDYSNSVYRLHVHKAMIALSLTPNLKHLSMRLQSEKYVLAQMVKYKICDELKSLSFRFVKKPRNKTLNTLLSHCSQLEYLKLEDKKDYKIKQLPSTLKFYYAHPKDDFAQVMEVVIGQNIALADLEMPYDYSHPCDFLTRMNLSKIKVCMDTLPSFNAILGQLSRLVVLDIELRDDVPYREVLCDIVRNAKNLQCLEVITGSDVINLELTELANLEHLTHISISSYDEGAVTNLLKALVDKGKLQYFYADIEISVDVCEILRKCEALTHIGWHLREKLCSAKLCKTLDEIYGEGTSPASPYDPRIRHFYFECPGWYCTPHHPWAVFHECFWTFKWNEYGNYNAFLNKFNGP